MDAERLEPEAKIDFALLDLLLPDGNGIELGARLIQQRPGLHVAIMTGAELTTAEENECRKYRFDVVNKPFLPQQIVSLVRERVVRFSQACA
jgi:DNA-binding NtrC family response regulator